MFLWRNQLVALGSLVMDSLLMLLEYCVSWCESVWIHLIWDSLCVFILLIFSYSVSLGESYLLWPWWAIFVWQCLCVACVSLISLFLACSLVGMLAATFLSVCWPSSSPQDPASEACAPAPSPSLPQLLSVSGCRVLLQAPSLCAGLSQSCAAHTGCRLLL